MEEPCLPGRTTLATTKSFDLSNMASLAATLREHLSNLAADNACGHLPIDFYRVAREQAELLYQAECIRQNLSEDPFQALADIDIESLNKRLTVVEYDCVRTRHDYVKVNALVQIQGLSGQRLRSRPGSRLNFSFERDVDADGGTTVSYTIDFSRDSRQPMQKLLWTQVIASGNHPSRLPAIDMQPGDADDSADWSDMESQDEEECKHNRRIPTFSSEDKISTLQSRKRAKMTDGGPAKVKERHEAMDDDEPSSPYDCDRYVAGMDPDVVAEFIESVGKMDEVTSFFLLMSFPFYEMEWDLVGFVLSSVFDSHSDGEDEEQEED